MAAKFALAGLLRLRQMQKDTAEVELAESRRELATHLSEVGLAKTRLAAPDAEPGQQVQLAAVAAARAANASMLTQLQAHTRARELAVAEAETVYAGARRKSAGLEKLAERHHASQVAAELAAEQNVLDEIATRSHQ